MREAGRKYVRFNRAWERVNVAGIVTGGVLAVAFRHHPGLGVFTFIAAAVSIGLRLTIGRMKGMRL